MLNNKRMLLESNISNRRGSQFIISTIYEYNVQGRTKYFIGFCVVYTPHDDNCGNFLHNAAHDIGLEINTCDKKGKSSLVDRLSEILKDHNNPVVMDFLTVCNRHTLRMEASSLMEIQLEDVSISLAQTAIGSDASNIAEKPAR